MKITLISIPVRDQEKAMRFYTEKLGFIKKKDEPLGGGNRWLILVSKDWVDGPELLLEPAPNHFEPSKVYQDALMEAGIPWTQFDVENVDSEYERLTELGVEFSVKPTEAGNVKYAIFNDTCGNNIQLVQEL
ncbi:MAG: VOC family protein [Bacteroidota bacterium]|uniref:VOC family protein n=1 Tax=Flagellimonas profundi TaxID=2915620 RepID=A0ABS3FI62_9FLAO|nr:VOC family protein [Allomuricauda profundi]MBO0342834.1 VOC family protein [Allomuricauda profundi]MEC7772442.1 VOC family protein [Bacteroidota bacterium]